MKDDLFKKKNPFSVQNQSSYTMVRTLIPYTWIIMVEWGFLSLAKTVLLIKWSGCLSIVMTNQGCSKFFFSQV